MFQAKKNTNVQRIIEFTITFNLTAIDEWIKSKYTMDTIQILGEGNLSYSAWSANSLRKSYQVTLLQSIESHLPHEIYFHKEKNTFSESIGGLDTIGNMGSYIDDFLSKTEIKELGWNAVDGSLYLQINYYSEAKFVLFVPTSEIWNLHTTGELGKGLGARCERKIITVPFYKYIGGKGNDEREEMQIWRSYWSQGITYMNSLALVEAHIPRTPLWYWEEE